MSLAGDERWLVDHRDPGPSVLGTVSDGSVCTLAWVGEAVRLTALDPARVLVCDGSSRALRSFVVSRHRVTPHKGTVAEGRAGGVARLADGRVMNISTAGV